MKLLKVKVVDVFNTIKHCGRANKEFLDNEVFVEVLGDFYHTDDLWFIHKDDVEICIDNLCLQQRQKMSKDLYELIAHGSDDHKGWLKSALDHYFLGSEMKDYKQ